jgi:hypothetical protein
MAFLTMEDSRCGRELEEQRLFAGFPCYCLGVGGSGAPPSMSPETP